jgi:hypothetical protein
MRRQVVEFELGQAVELLSRTPVVLRHMLRDLPDAWARSNEGPETWSPFDVLGHFIHGERTDWIPRARIILAEGAAHTFEPFDRFAQFASNADKTLNDLLETFALLRAENLETLKAMHLSPSDLDLRGVHPDLGLVTLQQLLATWVAHDLSHIGQIVQVMARQYTDEIGPWKAYFPDLQR